jgi:hypothetical protein
VLGAHGDVLCTWVSDPRSRPDRSRRRT